MTPRRGAVLSAAAGTLLGLLYLVPALPGVWEHGLDWPILNAHQEALSLSTYGKWWVYPPHRFLTDGFSGEFPTFYNYVSDALVVALAAAGGWPPMTVQVALYGPLMGALLLWASYLSLRAVGLAPGIALFASLIISLGGDAGLLWVLDPEMSRPVDALLHVPFDAQSLGTAQSLGWVLYLPCLAALHVAYRRYSAPRAATSGLLLGILLQAHTLTFIAVAFAQLLYLVIVNALQRPRDAKWGAWLGVLVLLLGGLAYRAVAHPPLSIGSLGAAGIAALLATFVVDPKKRFYLWSYGTAAVVAAPYLLALARRWGGVVEQPSRSTFPAGGLLVFFSVYVAAAALAYLRVRDRDILVWVSAMLLASLLLAFNDLWGWSRHPYRFAIDLLFPLAILAALGVRHGPRIVAFALGSWICVVMALNVVAFARGERLYAGALVGDPAQATFLEHLRAVTTAHPGGRLLNPAEFGYPGGVAQSAVLVNYSRLPGFIPDYRFLVSRAAYHNRMALFCFLFPGYPADDLHFGTRACEEQLEPPADLVQKIDPRLKGEILAVYGIPFAASVGPPFARALRRAVRRYGWKMEAAGGVGDKLVRTDPLRLEGIAQFGPGAYDPAGFEVEFRTETSGFHLVILAGRGLAQLAPRVMVDGHELRGARRRANWLVCGLGLAADQHHLRLEWTRTEGTRGDDCLYFTSVVGAAQASRYLRLAASPVPAAPDHLPTGVR